MHELLKTKGIILTNNDVRNTDKYLNEGKRILFGSFGLPSS